MTYNPANSYGPLLDVFMLDMRTHKNPNDANTSPTQPTEGHRFFGRLSG
ncbi:hypothetical protein [Actinomadura sp. B10D3]